MRPQGLPRAGTSMKRSRRGVPYNAIDSYSRAAWPLTVDWRLLLVLGIVVWLAFHLR